MIILGAPKDASGVWKIIVPKVLNGYEWIEYCLTAESLKYFCNFTCVFMSKENTVNHKFSFVKFIGCTMAEKVLKHLIKVLRIWNNMQWPLISLKCYKKWVFKEMLKFFNPMAIKLPNRYLWKMYFCVVVCKIFFQIW